jgi:tetratricopeptide (TPR) repeat protein/tRNA A-37 threonylcarbamoyl transferase component Bud32
VRDEANCLTRTADGQGGSRDLPRGTTIRYFGDYELQKELGRGGMGVVYKARQLSLNRPVALKMIKAGVLADDAEVRRFQNEAEAVALLDHAGIVPVYEVGEHDGQRYFSMKLVEGGNLAEQLGKFKSDPRAAATLLAEAALAVHHAHMRGILHRDLKPANILVDSEARPHVTDFGLAKRVEGDVEMTQSGAVLGTPAYMSPEQAYGRRGTITTATDVYGLGAILYALLTGEAPFGGQSLVDTLDAVRTRPPEPPRKRSPSAPRDLETVCLKCLEKDPRRRYPSAQSLADDLLAWLESRPISARRVGTTERAWLWCKRKPVVAALAAAVVFAVILGTTAVIAVQQKANRVLEKKNLDLQTSNTKLDEQRARAEERETQAIDAVKRFGDVVTSEAELKNSARLTDLRRRLLKEPLNFFKDLRDRLQSDHDTRPESLARLATANFDLGRLTSEIGDKEDAMKSYEQVISILERLVRVDPSSKKYRFELARIYNDIGHLDQETGRLADALIAYEKTRETTEALVQEDPTFADSRSLLAWSHLNMGSLEARYGRADAARASFTLARDMYERLVRENPNVLAFERNLSSTYSALGSYSQAIEILDRLTRNHPEDADLDFRLSTNFYSLAIRQSQMSQLDAALGSYTRAIEIQDRLVRDHRSATLYQGALARSLVNRGNILGRKGGLDDALAHLNRAREILERLTADNPRSVDFLGDLSHCYGSIGVAHRVAGRPRDALAVYKKNRVIAERLAREYPSSFEHASSLGACLNNVARAELDLRQFAEARTLLLGAIAWQKKALALRPNDPRAHEFLCQHLYNLSEAANGLGLAQEAALARRELTELQSHDPSKADLDLRLAAVRKGEAPKTNAERLNLAQRAYDRSLHAAAAQLFAEALKADAKLALDRQAQVRYNAACAAALAASGRGKDDPQPGDSAKTKLRRQALEWLNAELAVWSTLLESANARQRGAIVKTLQHWHEDTDLGGIRDEKELARLPEAERNEWQSLWAEVDALRKRADEPKP